MVERKAEKEVGNEVEAEAEVEKGKKYQKKEGIVIEQVVHGVEI